MKKILVIEDDFDVRENIRILLNEEGYTVLIADNGKDGITYAKQNLPDLILCDILMPKATGYEVLKELSKEKSTRTIPFIFLTAKTERDDIRSGMELGADDYIFKPFRSVDLLKSIETRLSKIEKIKAEFMGQKEDPGIKQVMNDDKIFIQVNGKPHLIKIGEILFITAESQYTSLNLINGVSYLLRKSVSKWEELLPQKNFLRIHRSTIINIDFLVKMEKGYNSSFIVRLKNVNDPFIISKRYSSKLRKMTM